jgi:hypothetical protein
VLSHRLRLHTILILALSTLLLLVQHTAWPQSILSAARAGSNQASNPDNVTELMSYRCDVAFEAPSIPLGAGFVCRDSRCTGDLERLICPALKSPFAFEAIALLTLASISRAFLDPIWILPSAIRASHVWPASAVVSIHTA